MKRTFEQIGLKSSAYAIRNLILALIFLLFGIILLAFEGNRSNILLVLVAILSVIVGVGILFVASRYLTQAKLVIGADEAGFYIHPGKRSESFINYKDIDDVWAKNSFFILKSFSKEYGMICIKLKTGAIIKVGGLSNVATISSNMLQRVNRNR